jgi:hypothetical protein
MSSETTIRSLLFCAAANDANGTSRHSLHCSDDGSYRTNNGQRAARRLKNSAAFDPQWTLSVRRSSPTMLFCAGGRLLSSSTSTQ